MKAAFLLPLFCLFAFSACAAAPIAQYINDDVHIKREGRRISEILKAANITFISVGTAGMTVNVISGDPDKARNLLAASILKEKLDIYLLVPSDKGNYEMISPNEAIKGVRLINAEQGAAATP